MMKKYWILVFCLTAVVHAEDWVVESDSDWKDAARTQAGLEFSDDLVKLKAEQAFYNSKLKRYESKRKLQSLTLEQTDKWLNWKVVEKVQPKDLRDAPVFFARGDHALSQSI